MKLLIPSLTAKNISPAASRNPTIVDRSMSVGYYQYESYAARFARFRLALLQRWLRAQEGKIPFP